MTWRTSRLAIVLAVATSMLASSVASAREVGPAPVIRQGARGGRRVSSAPPRHGSTEAQKIAAIVHAQQKAKQDEAAEQQLGKQAAWNEIVDRTDGNPAAMRAAIGAPTQQRLRTVNVGYALDKAGLETKFEVRRRTFEMYGTHPLVPWTSERVGYDRKHQIAVWRIVFPRGLAAVVMDAHGIWYGPYRIIEGVKLKQLDTTKLAKIQPSW